MAATEPLPLPDLGAKSRQKDPARQITDLLGRWREGDARAGDRVMEVIYAELKAIAANRLPRGRGPELDTTELVHETFLRLEAQSRLEWKNRAHFFAIAARLTRRVVIDHVRQRDASKRGGEARQVTLARVDEESPIHPPDWIELDDALVELGQVDSIAERIVVYRYFAGMSIEEVAEVVDMSPSTVVRRWRFARAFLERRLSD